MILEDINHKFDIILEAVRGLQEQLTHKADKEELAQVNDRVNILETSQRRVISDVRVLDSRVSKLES